MTRRAESGMYWTAGTIRADGRPVMKRSIVVVCVALVVAAFAVSAVPARAQEGELDSIVIEGRIMRPQASYIIQRANVDFGLNAKKRSFVSKIVQSIEDEPF